MRNGIEQILQAGRPPGARRSANGWRGFVSRIHDGDMQGASKFYADHRESVNGSKPKMFDIVKES